MNCTFCGKPIDEHSEGPETDVCVESIMGGNVRPIIPRPWTTDYAAAMRVWDFLPVPRSLEHRRWGTVVKAFIYEDGKSVVVDIAGLNWPLAICQAMLMVHTRRMEK